MFSRMRHICRTQYLKQAARCFSSPIAAPLSSPTSTIVKNLAKQDSSKMLFVTWNDNSVNRYPYIYLRDNCPCPKCFHADSMQRSFDVVADVDLDVVADDVEVLQNGEQVSVVWPDKHVSVYNSEWLHKRRLPEEEETGANDRIVRDGVELWDHAKMSGNFKQFDFERVMDSELDLFNWLHTLASSGIALLKNVSLKRGQVNQIAERVGYLKTTHYGHTFEVFSKQGLDLNNLAYTAAALSLHCDLPQWDYYPGLQLLHCIQQAPSKGGANMFVDGFNVAQQFRDCYPELYKLLCVVPIPYVDIGTDTVGDFHQKFARPPIELDYEGWLRRFSYNNHVRDYHLTVPPEVVQKVYEAYITLGKLCRDPANRVDYKMEPGDMITFNNSRVLHGRTSYTITEEGSRLLQGVYLDWDLVNSRIRVLGRKLNLPVIV